MSRSEADSPRPVMWLRTMLALTAIKAKTDTIPANPVSVSDVPTSRPECSGDS